MPTLDAHRALKARQIIGGAYKHDGSFDRARATRYELLGAGEVALVRLKGDGAEGLVDIRLARRLNNGKVIRLLKESRSDFRSFQDVMRFLEAVYAEHGGPKGEAPVVARATTAVQGGLRIVR